jgi:hypothetical protein
MAAHSHFVALLGILVSALTQAQDTSCFSNSTSLFEFLSNDRNPNEDTTVVLCSNTTFYIGNIQDDEVVGGSMPLVAFPNVVYQCGQDASSANNCVLTGGMLRKFPLNGR